MNHVAWDDFRLVKAIADTRSLNGAAAILNINHSTAFRRFTVWKSDSAPCYLSVIVQVKR